MFVLMLTTLHWEGKPSNLTYHNNRSLFFYYFFSLNGDKWPFRFVALKFKCTNIYKQLACSVLCFIKKGGEGVGWKRWGVGDKKEWGKLSFWGVGMGKEGKQSLWWLIKHIFQILTKGERLKRWLWNSLQWPNYVINLVGSTKLQCYTLPSMQFYSFIKNLLQTVLHMCSTLEKVRIYFNHKPKKHFILMS